MDIRVRATCSECWTLHDALLKAGEENIKCPNCGHTQKNLPEEELRAMGNTLRMQLILSCVALAAFAVGAGAFYVWVTQRAGEQPSTTLGIVFFVCTLAALVCGLLGSRTRYLIEY